MEHLTFEPIGFVRTGKGLKFQTPHQPDATSDETNLIELLPGRQFDLALQDLDSFDRIWLIWWFHRNKTWRPRAMPPRGPAKRRGTFATRSPHRPNPIGLTSVPLLKIEGLTITVGPLDLIDGTPILDIKPYIRTIDSFPDASLGWIEEIDRAESNSKRLEIQVSEPAKSQIAWLQARGVDFVSRAFEILSLDPRPHRTRRIIKLDDGRFRIACGPWRLFYRVEGPLVIVDSIGSGYSRDNLQEPGYEKIENRDIVIAFLDTGFSY